MNLVAAFTFTSAHDPTESSGVYKHNIDFTMAVLNRTSPMMRVYAGKYVNSGRELRLEGLGGPKVRRPTRMSEIACLQHYLRLSLPQCMQGNFILVVCHLCLAV